MHLNSLAPAAACVESRRLDKRKLAEASGAHPMGSFRADLGFNRRSQAVLCKISVSEFQSLDTIGW